MKKQLLKKFSAFIVTTMVFSASTNAQIVYTDVNPDTTLNCQGTNGTFTLITKSYNLDLNNDANYDFILTATKSSFNSTGNGRASITPQIDNAFITTTLNTAKKLVLGDTISSSQAWHDTTFQYLKKWNYLPGNPPTLIDTGEWDTVVDGYIGLQLIHAGQTYYGWVRLNVDVTYSSANLVIKDYAYNSIPNQPILAGQTVSTGVTENSFASSINLFPNPAKDLLTIDLGSNNKKVEVTIADITGKVIYTTIATDTKKVEVNTTNFAAGIYVVQIQSADFIATKKLVVEK